MNNSTSVGKYVATFLRVLVAAMFLLSAVSKLYPSPFFALTTFEIKQLLPLGFGEITAAYFSRTLIGIELALGILLLLPHYYKRLVLPSAFLLLFVFSAHLTYGILTQGNVGNCGCFGSLLPMTPVEALIKNIVAMGIIIYLFKVTDIKKDKLNFFLGLSVALASILLIYLVGPMQKSTTQEMELAPFTTEPTEADTLIDTQEAASPTQTQTDTVKAKKEVVAAIEEPKKKTSGYSNLFADIDQGRKILCFFAPSCEHCKEAARELTQLKKQIPDFPELRFAFMDEDAGVIPDFFKFAGANYPFKIVDIATFWKTLGTSKDTPGILYLWNGNVIKEYDGIHEHAFDMKEFGKIVVKKYSELK